MTGIVDAKRQSLWNAAARTPALPQLTGEISTDIAVVGGGLCGLTAALLLSRAGRKVAVLEARRLGRQVTGHTTAKVTSQHALIYDRLSKSLGEADARVYAEANQTALEWIAAQVRDRNIACDFMRLPAYAYGEAEQSHSMIEAEVEAARRLGLPATLVRDVPLPYPTHSAVRFDNQAQFHPVKYLNAMIAELGRHGCGLFENTRVIEVEDDRPCRVVAETGRVLAGEVIVATNLPILDRGGYFAKAAPYRHVVMAARLPSHAPLLDGMFISVESPTRSVRTAPGPNGPMLIAVGEGFKPGHADAAEKAAALEAWLRERFAVERIDSCWGNQDYFPVDHVPYVGKLLPGSDHIRIATGFQAWGMTNATAAAMMLADEILGRANPWAETFRSTRIHAAAGGRQFLKENLLLASHFVKDHLVGHAEGSAEALAPAQGAIVKHGGKPAAAYRDSSGRLHILSATCTHMGCHVHWNSLETSWDCPCHGSRYDIDGRVLNGPAVAPLKRL